MNEPQDGLDHVEEKIFSPWRESNSLMVVKLETRSLEKNICAFFESFPANTGTVHFK
jgi:hypothetical protein